MLRRRPDPAWLPRYSRPPGPGALLFLLILVIAIIWFLFRAA